MTIENLQGWFDFQDIYDQAVHEARPGDRLVEVGVAFGKSLAYLARRGIDSQKAALEIVGVDTWGDFADTAPETRAAVAREGGFFQAFRAGMLAHAPEELARVTLLRKESALAPYHFAPQSCSFVFVDGDHTYESVRDDLRAWIPRVRPGGILAGHDYNDFPGVARAVKERLGDAIEVRGNSWFHRVPLDTPPADRTHRHLFVGLTSADWKIEGATTQGLLALASLCHKREIGLTFKPVYGGSILVARSRLAMAFLASDATDFITLDADLAFNAEDAIRLLEHDVDIVLGQYPKREMVREPVPGFLDRMGKRSVPAPVTPHFQSRAMTEAEGGGFGLNHDRARDLYEITGTGIGFCRVRRAALETIVEKYRSEKEIVHATGERIIVLYDRELSGGNHWDDSEAFCGRARAAGFQVWLDPHCRFEHIGPASYSSPTISELLDLKRREQIRSAHIHAATGGDAADPSTLYPAAWYRIHYEHRDEYHAIAGILSDAFPAAHEIADFGCGAGLLLERFAATGHEVIGVDGSEHAKASAPASVRDRIHQVDLRTLLPSPEPVADLVTCLEVAEHIEAASADHLVDVVTAAARGPVFFTAATPGQGGTHHVNEQPHDYWIERFKARGFFYDVEKSAAVREKLSRLERMHWFKDTAMVFDRTARA